MHRLLLSIPLLLTAGNLALAQGTTTIIRQQGSEVEVTQVPNEPESAFMSFSEADSNNDGRIDRQEARNAGIMGFVAAGGGKGYLTPEEYQAAATATDVNAAP